MPAYSRMLGGRDRKHVGDIAVEWPAHLDTNRINQNQLGESVCINRGDLSSRPPAHGEAHEGGVSQVQMVDQIEVKEDQILKIIKVFGYWGTGKPRMYRLYDFVPFRQSIREGEPVDGPVATVKYEDLGPGPFADHGKVYAL